MRLALLALCLLQVGCNVLTAEQRQAEIDLKADQDREMRRRHMLATGGLRESEYDALSRRDGSVPATGGLPPPPTTAEMEQRAKAASR